MRMFSGTFKVLKVKCRTANVALTTIVAQPLSRGYKSDIQIQCVHEFIKHVHAFILHLCKLFGRKLPTS